MYKRQTRYYVDEFHLLLKEEQTAAYSVEIWKRFRKWGGIPTGITQNIKDLLSSREIENIFENSDFIYMLNQASGCLSLLHIYWVRYRADRTPQQSRRNAKHLPGIGVYRHYGGSPQSAFYLSLIHI